VLNLVHSNLHSVFDSKLKADGGTFYLVLEAGAFSFFFGGSAFRSGFGAFSRSNVTTENAGARAASGALSAVGVLGDASPVRCQPTEGVYPGGEEAT